MKQLKEGALQLLYDEIGEVSTAPLKIFAVVIIVYSIMAVRFNIYWPVYIIITLAVACIILFIVFDLIPDSIKTKAKNNRDRIFVDSLNEKVKNLGYKVELNIRRGYCYNAISIFDEKSLINIIELNDFEDIYNISLKEMLDFPKRGKTYPLFPKCNTLDELQNPIEAKFIRRYIDHFTDEERIEFFSSISYHTGKWCRKWYHSNSEIDVQVTSESPIRLKLIAQYIPKEFYESYYYYLKRFNIIS